MRGLLPYAALTALGCVLTTTAEKAQQNPVPPNTHRASPSTTFNDSENGVSFRYPSSWKLSKEAFFYMRPSISADRTPQAIVTFDPEGTLYETTVFDGLEFVYVVVPHSSPEACAKLITANTTLDAKPDRTVIVNKSHFYVFQTWRSECVTTRTVRFIKPSEMEDAIYLKLTFIPSAKNTADDRRALSDPEATTLERQLDSVLQSTKITEAK
jgi:hypothetical protein